MLSFFLTYRGELAALSAAVIWAIASIFYTQFGRILTPLVLNLAKSGIAIALVGLTLCLQGNVSTPSSLQALGCLSLSGAIGIGFGDTMFFESLNCFGARRALLMESLAPPLTALLALVFLQEHLPPTAWIGILLTIAGVAWVVVERVPNKISGTFRPLRGLGFGLLAALGQAIGAVLSRAALAGSDVSPLWSTLIRLTAGVLVLLLWVASQQQCWQDFKPLRSKRLILGLIGASFISTFLAIWLQQTSIKYTAAGIAQALSATSPLFVLPIALWMGDRVNFRAVGGVVLALGGIWLLFG